MQRKGRKKESLHLEQDFNMLKMFGSAVTLFYFVLFRYFALSYTTAATTQVK